MHSLLRSALCPSMSEGDFANYNAIYSTESFQKRDLKRHVQSKYTACISYTLTRFIFYLTNRFHVAVRLFSNRSQMTSKCGKNKKVAHEA